MSPETFKNNNLSFGALEGFAGFFDLSIWFWGLIRASRFVGKMGRAALAIPLSARSRRISMLTYGVMFGSNGAITNAGDTLVGVALSLSSDFRYFRDLDRSFPKD
ncbi:hypothetical protein KCP76_25615 [Salmonella enterica subsp. enterica serovar Weltevreden]|nr:hypothetical protein KCP76_25615 [Salmonella enterica subsp. enterica serovar Weltevreden]